jgi:hypothetical protein
VATIIKSWQEGDERCITCVGAHSMVATDLLVGLPEAFARTRGAAMEKPVPWQAWLPTPRDFSSNRRASDHGICADDEKAWPERSGVK